MVRRRVPTELHGIGKQERTVKSDSRRTTAPLDRAPSRSIAPAYSSRTGAAPRLLDGTGMALDYSVSSEYSLIAEALHESSLENCEMSLIEMSLTNGRGLNEKKVVH
jgi:hypothetical protein